MENIKKIIILILLITIGAFIISIINLNKKERNLQNNVIENQTTPGEQKAIELVKAEWKREWGSLDDVSFNDSSLREKEYNKLYNKLSKKYSGRELEYRIKQGLYQKGFRT